jgi:hypothetical protein
VQRKTQNTLDDSLKIWREFLINAGAGETSEFDATFAHMGMDWRGQVRPLRDVSAQSTIAELILFVNTGAGTIRRPLELQESGLRSRVAKCYPQTNDASVHPSRRTTPCTIRVRQIADTIYRVTITGTYKTAAGGTVQILDSLLMKTKDVPTVMVSSVVQDLDSAAFVTINDAGGGTMRVFVPRLAAIDPEIGKYTPAQAVGFLEGKIAGSERQVSGTLGVPVRGDLITLAGPVLLILAIAYLFFQIDHLTELAHGNEKAISDFAWPLTFRGYQGFTTGILSLLILPATAVWFLRFHGGTANAFSFSTGYGLWTWILFVSTVAAGWACFSARNRLVRTVFAKSG